MLSLLTIAAVIGIGALIVAGHPRDRGDIAMEEFYKLEYSHKYPISN